MWKKRVSTWGGILWIYSHLWGSVEKELQVWVVWGSPILVRILETWVFIVGESTRFQLLGEYVTCLSQRCNALKEKLESVKILSRVDPPPRIDPNIWVMIIRLGSPLWPSMFELQESLSYFYRNLDNFVRQPLSWHAQSKHVSGVAKWFNQERYTLSCDASS